MSEESTVDQYSSSIMQCYSNIPFRLYGSFRRGDPSCISTSNTKSYSYEIRYNETNVTEMNGMTFAIIIVVGLFILFSNRS